MLVYQRVIFKRLIIEVVFHSSHSSGIGDSNWCHLLRWVEGVTSISGYPECPEVRELNNFMVEFPLFPFFPNVWLNEPVDWIHLSKWVHGVKKWGPWLLWAGNQWVGDKQSLDLQDRRRKIDFHNSFRRTRRTKQRWRVEPNLNQMRNQWNHWNHWPMAFCLGLNCEWEMYSPFPQQNFVENPRISRSYRGEALCLESHLWIPSGYLT